MPANQYISSLVTKGTSAVAEGFVYDGQPSRHRARRHGNSSANAPGHKLVAFLQQSSRFLKPVYAGDTVYPLLTITALEPGRTTGVLVMRVTIHNQDKELVMEGEHRYLLRRKP